ncbi:MAG: hypothetical protein HY268_25720 [Deltaproteobacteria bacterium]|nr:hypothetical protein [Deltaproteobacteria bacterium]
MLAQFVGRQFGYRELSAARSQGVSQQIRSFYESYAWVPRKIDLTRGTLSAKDTFEQNIAQLNRFRPEVLSGYGSYLGALFRWAWEQRCPVFCPKVVVYGAEGLSMIKVRRLQSWEMP